MMYHCLVQHFAHKILCALLLGTWCFRGVTLWNRGRNSKEDKHTLRAHVQTRTSRTSSSPAALHTSSVATARPNVKSRREGGSGGSAAEDPEVVRPGREERGECDGATRAEA